jgi:hypothetical protein
MAVVTCPACKTAASPEVAAEGWCGECGKKIPPFAYHDAGAEPPSEKRPAAEPREPPPLVDRDTWFEIAAIYWTAAAFAFGGAAWWGYGFLHAGERGNDSARWSWAVAAAVVGAVGCGFAVHRLRQYRGVIYGGVALLVLLYGMWGIGLIFGRR